MRLINSETLQLHDFSLTPIPPYAILSHTWGDGEVSFRDMASPARVSRGGYAKILETCRLARESGLKYAWIDTCCIDKESSAELTESINSMFKWYKNAAVCYVLLQDLEQNRQINEKLARCRWSSRGWTLQELIAPRIVHFYDQTWCYRGSKEELLATISAATRIPSNVLSGAQPLQGCSVARKMAWAANRQTTRLEDTAYCLLGIFDVNMPLIYGEGSRAFRRLQEEIVKRHNDLTIFAWEMPSGYSQPFLGLFVSSPAAFARGSGIVAFDDDFADFSVTNKGLLVSGDLPMRVAAVGDVDKETNALRYVLYLGTHLDHPLGGDGGIYLRKVGPNLFYREGKLPLAGFGRNEINQWYRYDISQYYILTDPVISKLASSSDYRSWAIHVPMNPDFALEDTSPKSLWDVTDRVFLKPKPYKYTLRPMAMAMLFQCDLTSKPVRLVVLCDYSDQLPTCCVFAEESDTRLATMLFERSHREEFVFWPDLEMHAAGLSNRRTVRLRDGDETLAVSATFNKDTIRGLAADIINVFSLKFNVDRTPTGSHAHY